MGITRSKKELALATSRVSGQAPRRPGNGVQCGTGRQVELLP